MIPVNDPNIIAQLEENQTSQSPSPEKVGSIINPKNSFPNQEQGIDMILGAGDAIRNQMANIGNLIPGSKIPMARSSQGENYNAGHIVGDIAGFMGGGAAFSGNKIANLLSKMPISGALSRIGATSGYGAAQNPENRSQGAITGAIMGSGGEVIPLAFKGIGNIAEKINPIDYTKAAMGTIENLYKENKSKAGDIFQNLEKKYSNEKIPFNAESNRMKANPDFLQLPEHQKELMASFPELQDFYKTFNKNPTYKNLQDFQSQVGSEMRQLRNQTIKDKDWNKTLESLKKIQDKAQGKIGQYLEKKNPEDALKYNEAKGIWRDIVQPHHESDLLENIVYGRMKNIPEKIEKIGMGEKIFKQVPQRQIEPKELLSEIQKVSEKGKLPENHYLRTIQRDLTNKIDTGKLLNNIVTIGMGSALGQMMMPGLGAGIGGAGGAVAAKFLNPAIIGIAQNPSFIKGLQSLNKIYKPTRSAVTGYNVTEK